MLCRRVHTVKRYLAELWAAVRTPPANSLIGFSNASVEVRRSLGHMVVITRKGLTGLGHVPALIAVGYLALAVTALRMASHRGDISGAVPLSNLLAADEAYNSESSGAGALTFVFNMRDCREALRLARHWSSIHESGLARVKGVMLGAPDDRDELNDFLGREGITFPVDPRPDPRLLLALEALGLNATPLTLLTDDSYRPRLILPAELDSLAQLAQVELVRSQLGQLKMRRAK